MERAEVSASAPTVRRLGLAAWVLALITVAVGGDALLTGPLAPPALTDPGSWAGWAGARTPVDAAFAVLGLTLVVVAWYLLALTALQVAGGLVGAARLVAVSDVLTVPVVRRSLRAVLGVGLAGSVAAVGTGRSPAADVGTPGHPMALLVATAVPDQQPTDGGEPPAEPPVMRRLPDAAGEPKPPEAVGTPAPAAAPREWVVAPGDHLWSVAARVLEAAWETDASDDQVAPYWQHLVEANHGRLGDRGNPDLVYPGQRLIVVEPPPPPR